ncbi:hypothetical protein K8R03_02375 [Candidatus Kaiserbacteria bacterium]|nr:hypothetical protein [Candidatus Kaiserbacteria bacterium]
MRRLSVLVFSIGIVLIDACMLLALTPFLNIDPSVAGFALTLALLGSCAIAIGMTVFSQPRYRGAPGIVAE